MTMPNVTASGQGPAKQSRGKPGDVRCPPMVHQNCGNHGSEMYPQQFVRLVGCHDASLGSLRKRQNEKVH